MIYIKHVDIGQKYRLFAHTIYKLFCYDQKRPYLCKRKKKDTLVQRGIRKSPGCLT